MKSRGVVLIIVLIVVAALAFSAYAFSGLMFTHNEATQVSGRQVQAESLMASGVEAARAFLMQDTAMQAEGGGSYDNGTRFRAINVVNEDNPAERGNFTVLSPSLDTDGNPSGVRYGLENESARLNLNALFGIEKQVQTLGQQSPHPVRHHPQGGSRPLSAGRLHPRAEVRHRQVDHPFQPADLLPHRDLLAERNPPPVSRPRQRDRPGQFPPSKTSPERC